MSVFESRLESCLAGLERADLLRRSPAITDRVGASYRVDGTPVVGFCSNDYLGLADATELAAREEPRSGAGASRLICGDLAEHREIEQTLAGLVGLPDAVLFPSGFQLNVGVIPAIVEPEDHVASDQLNHASLIDGMRLARVRPKLLPHGHAPSLAPSSGVSWWITESVFSMDGDRIDPAAIADHQQRGGATYVDEAHALGLFRGGQGWLASQGVKPTLLVGTLSKALGSAGAFIAGSRRACTWIRNRARSYVFSTGTSPVVVARLRAAVHLVVGHEGERRRERLWSNAAMLARRLGESDAPPSPIFPLLVGANSSAVSVSRALLACGWHVQAIRPPTVPEGTARLRITVRADHEPSTIDRFADDLLRCCADHGISPSVERGRVAPL